MNASILSHAAGDVNPHALPIGPYAEQVGDLLTAPNVDAAKRKRRDALALEKLTGREFTHDPKRPGVFVVTGGDVPYILTCVERLGEIVPASCTCPARKPCSHQDALTHALGQVLPSSRLLSCSPCDGFCCKSCGGPAVKVGQFTGPRGYLFDVFCAGRLIGSCQWRLI
jgi:hypothetical protein